MTSILLTLLAIPQGQGLQQAAALYQEAHYQKALDALTGACTAPSNEAPCERLRAFIHAALGEREKAVGAFARYILSVTLPGGAVIPVGSKNAPKEVLVSAPMTPGEDPYKLTTREGAPAAPGGSAEPLPAWAGWSIAGGTAVATAAAITLAVVLRDTEPGQGAIRIGIRLEG